jgi:PAS domain S-box-containing protein
LTRQDQSIEKALRARLAELDERAREHESIVRALQAGEVDAFVILQEGGDRVHQLQSDEPLYRTIVDALPQAVATVLSDGTLVYANRQLATLIGTEPESLLGLSLLEHIAHHDRDLALATFANALQAPCEASIVFTWQETEMPAVVSAIRLPISGVDAVGLVIMDVSDQVARRAAEEASRAKDDLLALVSHELRTPLTAISGWVQLIELEAHAEQMRESLTHLKDAIAAEVKIVDDLLDLSRSERGSLTLVMNEFDLRDVLRTAAAFVELQAKNKSVALNVTIPDEPLLLRGDPDRLRQVFVNLLTNALKFTAAGEVSFTTVREGREAVVNVTDSGAGISHDFLPFVFEPFRRADRTRTSPGLGIGLSIARRLVEAHAGTIGATSEGINRGARFTVRLPLL